MIFICNPLMINEIVMCLLFFHMSFFGRESTQIFCLFLFGLFKFLYTIFIAYIHLLILSESNNKVDAAMKRFWKWYWGSCSVGFRFIKMVHPSGRVWLSQLEDLLKTVGSSLRERFQADSGSVFSIFCGQQASAHAKRVWVAHYLPFFTVFSIAFAFD